MLREKAIARLATVLPNRNLYELAVTHGVTISRNGRINKGWVGQTLEKIAALDAGNAARRDGIDFELKSTSLFLQDGAWMPKEAIRITQLNPRAILDETFETSTLWEKLERLILVGLHHESADRCVAIQLNAIDVADPALVG